ncbi:hypothetical protein AB3459_15765, partial [Pseudomonas aeruginosa]
RGRDRRPGVARRCRDCPVGLPRCAVRDARPAGAEPARAKGSAYGLVSRAGRSLSPAAAVFVERVLEQDRRFAAT